MLTRLTRTAQNLARAGYKQLQLTKDKGQIASDNIPTNVASRHQKTGHFSDILISHCPY